MAALWLFSCATDRAAVARCRPRVAGWAASV